MTKTLASRAMSVLSTLSTLPQDGKASPEQIEALRAWPGWGPLAPAFEAEVKDSFWANIHDRLMDFFGDDVAAYMSARESLDNSFYTPAWLVQNMWRVLADAGFSGGRVLEPGCGSGRFMASVPEGVDAQFVGVERDATTARIARLLNPGAHIIHDDLARVTIPPGSFDVAIGNVPFSSRGVYDPGLPDGAWWNTSLHHYFTGRALQAVRPGGYVVLIVSRYLLDGATFQPSAHPETRANFVGAVRLPNRTFGEDGTDTCADIVVLQRSEQPWLSLPSVDLPPNARWARAASQRKTPLSTYWAKHPEQVAGEMVETGFDQVPLKVVPGETPRADVERGLGRLVEVMPEYEPARDDLGDFLADVVLEDEEGRPEGSFHVQDDGTVAKVVGGRLEPVKRAGAELHALIGLREAISRLLDMEADTGRPDADILPVRQEALALWRGYVAKWGPLNRGILHEGAVDPDTGLPALTWKRPTLGGFRCDPAYPLVMAMEVFDPETQEAEPAPILLRRVNCPPVRPTSADSPAAALAISLAETGAVDQERIAALLSVPVEQVPSLLGELVFIDHRDTSALVAARTYLSGNVRQKLAEAEVAVETCPELERNVEALREVIPEDLGPLDIRVSLGAPWIAPAYVHQFCIEVLGSNQGLNYVPELASWSMEGRDLYRHADPKSLPYATGRMDAYAIFLCGLNGKTPIVYDEVYRERNRTSKVRNAHETMSAQEKLSVLQQRFAAWVWEDPERSVRLCREYNRRFNSYVTRRADGSHLTFPGMSSERTLWDHQRDIVDQITSSTATLCGHAVGGGKTLSAIASVMTLKHLGLARKPMIVVPNHLLEQIAREARQAYPLGRFLVAGKGDLAGDGRRLFAARCATSEWDAVIITHAGFTSLPLAPHHEQNWVIEQKLVMEDAARREKGNRLSSKRLARRLRSLENRLAALRDQANDPRTILFDHLGVDFLAVDEAHMFRRLPIVTMGDISFESSKRATDLLLKVRALRQKAGGRPHVAMFTGTPWVNSLVETFVWQTYIQPEVLETAGVSNFDQWAATFIRRETRVEVAPDGSGFRVATRPTALMNVPELRSMLLQNADILPPASLHLDRPEAQHRTLVAHQSPAQEEYVHGLVKRADALRSGNRGDGKDNMLVICNDGRKIALDPRLVGLDESSPKVEAVVREVAAAYHSYKDRTCAESAIPGALHVIFCDLGTPGDRGTQTYGRIRDGLVASGVPVASIRWIHEANSDKAKDALFAACRDGKVSVLIGSTEKMGYGTNIQRRLATVHHADAPWRPADIEQREGRALRPGNLNSTVEIVRYVTEGTFDAYMWQTLETKARFVAQMFTADAALREVDDISPTVLSFAEVKALASGNPLLLDLARSRAEVERLTILRSVDAQMMTAASQRIETNHQRIEATRLRLEKVRKAHEKAGRLHDGPPWEQIAQQVAETATRTARREKTSYSSRTPTTHFGGDEGQERPFGVHMEQPWSDKREWKIDVAAGYFTLASEKVSLTKVRRGGKALAAMILSVMEAACGDLPSEIARLRERIDALVRENVTLREQVESYSFPQAQALAAAQARVARISAEIENEAAPPANEAA